MELPPTDRPDTLINADEGWRIHHEVLALKPSRIFRQHEQAQERAGREPHRLSTYACQLLKEAEDAVFRSYLEHPGQVDPEELRQAREQLVQVTANCSGEETGDAEKMVNDWIARLEDQRLHHEKMRSGR